MRYIHRVTVWCLTISTLLIIVSLVSSGIGPVKLSSNLFLKVMLTIFFGETNLLTPTDVTILVTLRLPRIILAATVGFALAAA